MVLTNPPFGKKSSITIINEEGEEGREALTIFRDDFWAPTSNKQLNFVQHIVSLLKMNGRAAIVVPDNVLFEGGAGETIRRKLLGSCDVHTLLRLPTGIFYAQGVKANVLFFDRKPASETPWTKALWIYDLRTNNHFTLKTNTLKRADLDDFLACCNPKNHFARKESERFRCFSYDDLQRRDKLSLDITWLRDESLEDTDNLPDPAVLDADPAPSWAERLTRAHFAIVSQAFSKEFFPHEDPLGKHISMTAWGGTSYEIIGIVGDTPYLVSQPIRPMMYFPLYEGTPSSAALRSSSFRSQSDEPGASHTKTNRANGPESRGGDILTLDQVIGQSTAAASFNTYLLLGFAGLSLLLAAMGPYGVLSYVVTQRTKRDGHPHRPRRTA